MAQIYGIYMKKVGTGAPPAHVYENYTDDAGTWTLSGGSSHTVVNEYGRNWIEHYRTSGSNGYLTSTTPTFTFDDSKNYHCSFYHSNFNNYNYMTQFEVGPFVLSVYRDGNDYIGMKSTSDNGWDNYSTNAFSVTWDHIEELNVFCEIRYESLDASTGRVTAWKNSSQVGQKTINKSSIATRSTAWMHTNADQQRVSTILIDEI